MDEMPPLNFVAHVKIDLVGTQEIAQMISVSRQRADQLHRYKGFPEPVCTLAHGSVWLRSEVRAWALANGRTVK